LRGNRGGRRGTLGLAAAVVALAATGCGDGDSEAPEALEGEAAAKALAEGATLTNDSTEPVEASLGGAVTGLGLGDQEFSFDGSVDPESETGTFAVEVNGATFDLILTEDAAYISSDEPTFTDALPEGAEWIELSVEELNSSGINTGFKEGAFSPQLYLALGATDIEAGGSEEVGDDPVRSYSFTIDEAKAVEEAPTEVKSDVEDAINLEGEDPTIKGEATLDSEGRMRSFNAVGTVGSLDGAEVEVTLGTELVAFGVEIDAEPPDPDATVPLTDAPDALTALQSVLVG